MKVSVIVPLYNTRAYIDQAIDSILAQTRPADEVVVVDDGSTDGGPDLLARYGSAVRVIRQAHAGGPTTLNRGIAETTGEAIAFLDGDDLWAKRKLEQQVPALLAAPEIDGVFGFVQQFGDAGEAEKRNIPSEPQRGVSRIGLLIRRSAFDRFGPFDETLQIAEFFPWYSRAIALGLNVKMLPDVVAYRRIHGANTGLVRRTEQQQENLLGLKRALDLRRRRGGAPSGGDQD